MTAGITLGSGITVGGGIGIGTISFTASPADITFSGLYYGGYSDDTSAGFTSIGNTNIVNGVAYTIAGSTQSQVNSILTLYPFLNSPYAWNVSWTSGGSGIVRMEISSSRLIIAPIDTIAYPNWANSNDQTVSTQAGAFTFPATFTLYSPKTAIQTSQNDWC